MRRRKTRGFSSPDYHCCFNQIAFSEGMDTGKAEVLQRMYNELLRELGMARRALESAQGDNAR